MKKISIFLTMALLLIVTSCLKYDKDEGLRLTRTLQVSVSVDGMDSVTTKSAVTAQDVTAENINLWVYDSTGLVFDGYFTDDGEIKVEGLTVGTTYYVRAVANAGLIIPPMTVAQADALTFDWDISALNVSSGIPMTFKESVTLNIASSLNIHFKRVAAKYIFVIDQSGFTGKYTIKSLRLCNSPSKVKAFDNSAIDGAAVTSVDGDYASPSDLAQLNQGKGVHFFIYENLQGDILPDNTDPWKKEFENYNTVKAAAASRCTYLEVLGDYATTGVSVENLRYRIYLGANATSNFDITRNTAYTVVLAPTEVTAIDEDLTSWKVEKGTITDTRDLRFNPASIRVPSMGQATATVIPTPSSLEYVLEPGENFTASGLTFVQENNDVTVCSGSIVESDITAKLVARTLDGERCRTLVITVLPPEMRTVTGYEYNEPILELSYSDVGANGSSATPTLTYSQTATRIWSDGSRDENVVIAAVGSAIPSGVTVTWGGSAKNSSGGSIDTGNGKVSAKNRGTDDYSRGVVFTATAGATINGKAGSTSEDVFQVKNEVVSTVQADSKTENSDWNVGTYQETGFSNVAASGGTASFQTCAYHVAKVYKKYTRTWSSGSSATSDWEYVSQSNPYDNVTISSNQSWARVSTTSAGGDFKGVTITVDANTGAARSATITLKNGNGNTATRTISQLAGISVKSYGIPTVTLSYPGPVAYNSTSAVSPTLTVKQVYNYSDGSTETRTLSSGEYTVKYSGSAEGFSLSSSTGKVTPQSNAGVTTKGGTTYGEIENLSFSYDDIPVAGGSSSPKISYSQTKTVVTDARTSTSERSIQVTATVTAHNESNTASASVTQNGDSGQTSTTTKTPITSGASISYSVVSGSSALSHSSGKITAGSNAGSGGGVVYGDPVVTFSPSNTVFPLAGATYNLDGVSFTQTKTTKGRSSTDSRSKKVSASLSLNGKTASTSATCTQNGDSGTDDKVETVTTGGTVSYSGSATGFECKSSYFGKTLKADPNEGTSSNEYSEVSVSNFSYPDVSAEGGKASPTGLTYSQTKTESRTSTSARSIVVTAKVEVNSKEGTATATFTQPGDEGQAPSTTNVTDLTVKYSDAAYYTTGFSVNSSTGEVTWSANSSTTSDRTADVKVTVSGSGSKSGSKTATSKQLKKGTTPVDPPVVTHTLTAEWVGNSPIYMNNTVSSGRQYKVYYDGSDVTSSVSAVTSGAMSSAAGGTTYWNNVGEGSVYFTYKGVTSNTLKATSESIVDFIEIRLDNWSADDDDPGVNPKFEIKNGKISNGGTTNNGFRCNGAMYGSITYSIHLDVYAHYKTDSGTTTSATHLVGMIDYDIDIMKGDSDYWTELDVPAAQRSVLNSLWITFKWQGIAD